ncbi:MAG TPA: Cys-tRNA(Pro) deacylase [Nocardioidaceae bacterium]|nr:Cys-tRNA(Pro) deacylase [Nocardioidaceae bacterium]
MTLDRAGVPHEVRPYEHDPTSDVSYGEEAARALGVDPARVFKTLVVSADGVLGVAVVPVTRELDLKAMARALGAKRVGMADPSAAERSTGYVVGGISPLGQRQRLATVVDSSAYEADVIFVSGGRRGLDIGLAPADLVALTSASTAPIARTSP